MSRRMLRGIKERAERAVVATPTSGRVRRHRRFANESAHEARLVKSMPRRALGQGG